VVEGLAEKELIEERGRSEAIGRPVLFGTTGKFLEYFDLKDLGELPELDDESLEEAIRDFSADGADHENNGEAWGQTKLELSEN
jgi:chromosome segregation and condensation protein ScpB